MGAQHHVVTASWGSEAGAWSLLVHGGAGTVPLDERARHAEGCRAAAAAGAEVLGQGGSALDAVQRAVEALEDDPLFNAGTGACLTEAGTVELDASIMSGHDLRAGGVCALPPFRHAIAIARAVLDDGEHVLYAASGAERFALARGFVRAGDEDLVTDGARQRLEAARAARSALAAPSGGTADQGGGTVGAVARDRAGHVAAATSTGGRVHKRLGRVGDSPIPGAGNYADDSAGACSCTGEGEAILRVVLGSFAVERLRSATPERAALDAIARLTAAKGNGGLILVDRDGRLGLARGTATMAWAAAGALLEGIVAGY